MIRRYPAMKEEYAALHTAGMIANYAGTPRDGNISRSTECLAMRELPSTKQREYEAVRHAIDLTERYRNGVDRLRVIRLVLWDRSHTLEGAALMVPCHYKTAQGWHNEFIRLVAEHYGLMDS